MTGRIHGLEDNLDGLGSGALLWVGVAAIVAIVVGIACVVIQDARRTRRQGLLLPPEPPQPRHRCHVKPCPYAGQRVVTRRDTRQRARVCYGHLDEGYIRGWWLA